MRMSESTYIHFLSTIFLIILTIRTIFKTTKYKEQCKCVECTEANKIYLLKNTIKKEKPTQKECIKETIHKIFYKKRMLFFTIPLIVYSLWHLLTENDFFEGLPKSYKTLEVDIDATLYEIETAHREKLIALREFRGTPKYIEKQKKISDAYNFLKLNIKDPKFKSSTNDLSTIKDVPNSYLIIVVYLFSIIYVISNAFMHMKNRSTRNRYGLSYNLIKDLLEGGLLERNLNDWKNLGVINVVGNIIKKSLRQDLSAFVSPIYAFFNKKVLKLEDLISIKPVTLETTKEKKLTHEGVEEIGGVFKRILVDCLRRLDTSVPYKLHHIDFITLSLYLQIFRLNILNEVLLSYFQENEITEIQMKEILNLKDHIIFTAFQVLPCLKKICSSKQILYLLFRVHTDLLRGNEFARKVPNSQPSDFIREIPKTNILPYKYTEKDILFNPPLTVYTGINENLSIPKSEKGLSSQYIPYENHTIIKLRFNPQDFQQGLIQKGTYHENNRLVHDPYLFPLNYEGIFNKLCNEGSLFLTPVDFKQRGSKENARYFMPKKTYTLFLFTDNTITAVENIMDFIGERDIVFELRSRGCILYSDDTGLAMEIK